MVSRYGPACPEIAHTFERAVDERFGLRDQPAPYGYALQWSRGGRHGTSDWLLFDLDDRGVTRPSECVVARLFVLCGYSQSKIACFNRKPPNRIITPT